MDETDVDDVVVALVNCAKRVYNLFPAVFVSSLSFFFGQFTNHSSNSTNAKASSSSLLM